jgi:hypothetical protein
MCDRLPASLVQAEPLIQIARVCLMLRAGNGGWAARPCAGVAGRSRLVVA